MTHELPEDWNLSIAFEGSVKLITTDKDDKVIDEHRLDDHLVCMLLRDAVEKAITFGLEEYEAQEAAEAETEEAE